MAKDFNVILGEAQQIKNEFIEGANTANRLGTCLEDIVQRAEVDEAAAAKATTEIKAGDGLIGGGTIEQSRTISVGATDDSVVVGADGIKVDTQDNLTSTSSTKPLSAKQGKALQDNKADKSRKVNAGAGLTGGGDLAADRTIDVVSANDGITVNADNIQLNTINDVTSTSATKPLSANQGKVLNDKVVQVETNLNTLAAATNYNPYVNKSLTGYSLIREFYVPDSTKIVTNINIRKAIVVTGSNPVRYRNLVTLTYSDGTSDKYDNLYLTSQDAAIKELAGIIVGVGSTFYILFSENLPIGTTYINFDNTYNIDATHNIENAPAIKILFEKNRAIAEEIKHVPKADIVDNVVDGGSTKVLSASQGVYLNTKIDEIYGSMFNTFTFGLEWEDNKLMIANGGVNIIDSSSTTYYNKCSTTKNVDCSSFINKKIKIKYGIQNTRFAFYNGVNMVGISTVYSGSGNVEVTVPGNATSFKISVWVANISDLSTAKTYTEITSVIKIDNSSSVTQRMYSLQLFGAMDYALPTDFYYSQILFFGQSFAQGGSSKIATTGVIPNCFMFGDNLKAISGAAFNPLKQTIYEYPVVSCSNALSQMYRRYGHDINIVASTAGTGGVSITTLLNSYVPNVQLMHAGMKSVADAAVKSVGCFAIVYMQGESDYREGNINDKAAYKGYLMQVKNALQESAMTNLGQTRKPLFFLYQTSGSNWIVNDGAVNNESLGVSMAQIEFAQENEDVILISPAYQVTFYANDGHPSTNGERWLGEYYAKAIWQTLYRGFRYSNPKPEHITRESNRIIIYLSNCVLPLMLNTWTLAQQTNYGFVVKADDVSVAVSDIKFDNNAIVLNLSTDVSSATKVSISYGGAGIGRGNVCDSDSSSTWLKYLSDVGDTGYDGIRVIGYSPKDEKGNSIVGNSYPMNNFLSVFYKELN